MNAFEFAEITGQMRVQGAVEGIDPTVKALLLALAAVFLVGIWYFGSKRRKAIARAVSGGCLACGETDLDFEGYTQRCAGCGYVGELGGGNARANDQIQLFLEHPHRPGLR